MDLSMALPTMLAHERDEELAWYRSIDDGPWRSLAATERVTFPSWALTVQLSAAAAVTERVRLWSLVAVLPARNSTLFAKELATIDRLSAGRLTVGVGIGGHDEDYGALGIDATRRRQRMDEQVQAMRDVWEQVPPLAGHLPVGPPPAQSSGPPLIAGVSGPKALARAARWASGVSDPTASVRVDGARLAVLKARTEEAWREAGRTDRPHFSTCTWFALGPDAKDQLRSHIWDYARVFGDERARSQAEEAPAHSPAALRIAVDVARGAGVDELFLLPTTADPAEIDRARDALGI